MITELSITPERAVQLPFISAIGAAIPRSKQTPNMRAIYGKRIHEIQEYKEKINETGVSVPGALKLDHLQSFKPILF